MKRVFLFLLSGFLFIVGSARADYIGYSYTPKGTKVPVTVTTTELTPALITLYNNQIKAAYPTAIFVRNSSRKYNCHSYAWITTSAINNRWLNAPNQEKYWLDGSYKKISGWPLQAGAKISYRSGRDHSAIVYWYSGILISKWGQGPVMKHTMNDCPYGIGSFVYWQFLRN